jgi:hypothetical protein
MTIINVSQVTTLLQAKGYAVLDDGLLELMPGYRAGWNAMLLISDISLVNIK